MRRGPASWWRSSGSSARAALRPTRPAGSRPRAPTSTPRTTPGSTTPTRSWGAAGSTSAGWRASSPRRRRPGCATCGRSARGSSSGTATTTSPRAATIASRACWCRSTSGAPTSRCRCGRRSRPPGWTRWRTRWSWTCWSTTGASSAPSGSAGTAWRPGVIRAGATVLAAGGAGRLFSVTSNPVDVTGGGYALALRAGAPLRDMEFVQFYPWRCIRPFGSSRVPVQPSTFVSGARLYNRPGRALHGSATTRPGRKRPLVTWRPAPSSTRSAAASTSTAASSWTSRTSRTTFRHENSKVTERLDPRGIDYRSIPLVLAPEAHFVMGGVQVDEWGAASRPGLYACGETAGGTHGGNRLNSNAVPETQVFGHRGGVRCGGLRGGAAEPGPRRRRRERGLGPPPEGREERQPRRLARVEGAPGRLPAGDVARARDRPHRGGAPAGARRGSGRPGARGRGPAGDAGRAGRHGRAGAARRHGPCLRR